MLNEGDEKDMAVTERTLEELRNKIKQISKSTPVLKGKDGMIELDPENPHHREWFEEDRYRGE